MAGEAQEDRTESASQFRREEFRRQGTVALSKELLSIAVLLAVGGALYVACGQVAQQFKLLAEMFFKFGRVETLEPRQLSEMGVVLLRSWGWMVAPVFLAAMIIGGLACAAQVGFHVTWEPLSPKWERLNPVTGFQRLFSGQSTVEALKSIVKLVIGGFVVWSFLKGQATSSHVLFGKNAAEVGLLILGALSKLFFSLLLALSFVAVLDYAYQRYRLEQQMKMTKREAKEEFKLREGDPLIKQRIRTIQRRMASRRMMEAVPKADVIVTNPTHIAVALKYDPDSMAAPRVVAKGAGVIAQKIREIARFHRIPIVENKPLARAMHKEIDIGGFIPKELYKAVAEVLAYVYRLRKAAG